jgi:hypothetical protein
MSSSQQGGTSLLPEDNLDYEEAQYDGFSSITTRAAAKHKAEYSSKSHNFLRAPRSPKERSPDIIQVHR